MKGVAGPPEDPRPTARLLAEPLDENALSNPGLACDENKATPPARCIGEALVEHRDRWRALEQLELSVLLLGIANSLRHSSPSCTHPLTDSSEARGERLSTRISFPDAAASLRPRECSHEAPHAALAEAGADYTLVLVERDELGRSPPAYFALNPWVLVPTLEDRDLVLTESAAIIGGAGSTPVLSLRRREDGRSYAGKEGVTRAHASIHARPWKGRLSAARSAKPLQMAENDRESLSPIPNTSLTENRSEMYPFPTRKLRGTLPGRTNIPANAA